MHITNDALLYTHKSQANKQYYLTTGFWNILL